MSSRPLAADDADTISRRVSELQRERLQGMGCVVADVEYFLDDTTGRYLHRGVTDKGREVLQKYEGTLRLVAANHTGTWYSYSEMFGAALKKAGLTNECATFIEIAPVNLG